MGEQQCLVESSSEENPMTYNQHNWYYTSMIEALKQESVFFFFVWKWRKREMEEEEEERKREEEEAKG